MLFIYVTALARKDKMTASTGVLDISDITDAFWPCQIKLYTTVTQQQIQRSPKTTQIFLMD